jgi:heavy metal sensor kinase
MAIFDGSGRLLAENSADDDFSIGPAQLGSVPDQDIGLYTFHEEDDAEDQHRVAARLVKIPPQDTPYIIVVGQPLEIVDDELESLREILYYVVPVALALAGLGGWFLARKSLAPVVAMSERARRIGAGNLDQRLPVENPRDELGRLATAFNELLARLAAAFAQQRQFMADASHEMRTPLSVARITAGVTLEKSHRDEGEYRDAIRMIDEQARRLTRIVEDMFILARADAGRYPLRKTKFYLDEMIEETARTASVLASSKQVAIDIVNSSEAFFYGDEDLLRQMVLNLLDNAIKHTPPSGAVRLRVNRRKREYLIEVSDTGAGIPAEAQPRIFERFYRGDKARSRSEGVNGSGAGLGLAIARWIAEAHEGSLELVRSDEIGTTFLVTLPTSDGG